MPLRKLPEHEGGWRLEPEQPCTHAEHNPPTMIVLEPGLYEHTCPGCGKEQRFRVQPPVMW